MFLDGRPEAVRAHAEHKRVVGRLDAAAHRHRALRSVDADDLLVLEDADPLLLVPSCLVNGEVPGVEAGGENLRQAYARVVFERLPRVDLDLELFGVRLQRPQLCRGHDAGNAVADNRDLEGRRHGAQETPVSEGPSMVEGSRILSASASLSTPSAITISRIVLFCSRALCASAAALS